MSASGVERVMRNLAVAVLDRDLLDPLWPGLTESDWADDAKALARELLATFDREAALLAELARKDEALHRIARYSLPRRDGIVQLARDALGEQA